MGDPFDVDYVAHEMGHQYGGNHTQNNSCNRASSAAYEPGSASSIMGYAGICAPNAKQLRRPFPQPQHQRNDRVHGERKWQFMCCDVCHGQRHSHRECRDRWFGVAHFNPHRIDGHGVRSRWGCGDLQLGRIRFGTCHGFRGQQPYEPFWKPADFPVLFVHKLADTNPAKGQDLVNNTTTIGEHLPTYSRQLNFKCSIRDNRAGGGGFSDDLKTMTVTANAGPFVVQAPNGGGTVVGNTQLPVTWDVAGTDGNGVNCSSVDIYLSTDGGYTFPTLLVAGTPTTAAHRCWFPTSRRPCEDQSESEQQRLF